jgi:hypothetical protein
MKSGASARHDHGTVTQVMGSGEAIYFDDRPRVARSMPNSI